MAGSVRGSSGRPRPHGRRGRRPVFSSGDVPARKHVDRSAEGRLAAIMARLPEMERRVLDARYGISGGHPASRSAVASSLGLSAGEVGEIEARAFTRIREVVPAEDLAGILSELTARR